MKKRFFLVGTIATMSLGVFLLSCEKEKEEEKSCFCVETAQDGSVYSNSFYPSSWGAKDCNELNTKLRAQALSVGLNSTFSCR